MCRAGKDVHVDVDDRGCKLRNFETWIVEVTGRMPKFLLISARYNIHASRAASSTTLSPCDPSTSTSSPIPFAEMVLGDKLRRRCKIGFTYLAAKSAF